MAQLPVPCKRCLLRDMTDADKQNIQKYKSAIQGPARVSEEQYEARLSLCTRCDLLHNATCNACGCYVELRALTMNSHCPHKKW